LALLDSPPPGHDSVIDRTVAIQIFHNGVSGTLKTVTEDREGGDAGSVIDGVIPPFSCRDSAAVEREKLVQFGPGKEEVTFEGSAFGKTDHLRHRVAARFPGTS